MFEHDNTLMLETDDQCYDCQNKIHCPLMQTVSMGVATLNYGIYVDNCHFYKPTLLKVIQGGGQDHATETTDERTSFSPKLVD